MTSNGANAGNNERHKNKSAAESTRFRSQEMVDGNIMPAAATGSSDTSFYSSGKSMRLSSSARPGRGGLAAKITIPVVAGMLAGMIAFGFFVRNKIAAVHMESLKQEAMDTAFTVGLLGQTLFVLRDDFWRERENDLHASELPSSEHWLPDYNLVSEKDWSDATGFSPNEYAPLESLTAARENLALKSVADWLDGHSQMVVVYLLDADLTMFAHAEASDFRIDTRTLRAAPPPPPAAGETRGGINVVVDQINNVAAEPLIRGIARIYSRTTPDKFIGAAVIILRTSQHPDMLSSLVLRMGLFGLSLVVVMAVVAWRSAKRVITPVRRLAADMQAIAEGDYNRRSALAGSDEIGLFAQAFNSMVERLRVARANEKENSRLESDLSIARSIQNNLLPLQTPRVRGLDIHTSYRPAKEIGGDYFDFLPVDTRHMGIVIADASGKSIPAALVMSTTRAILRFVAPGSVSAAEVLTRVNAVLSVDIPKGMFVSAYYVILDPLNNRMLCASAGHTPLLIARADGSVELMNPGGIALGFDSGPIFQRSIREQWVALEKGDRVLLYTDGVVECVNPANEEYSDRRLREFLRRNRELSSHDFVGALMADLDRYRGTADMRDDTTIVTFKVL